MATLSSSTEQRSPVMLRVKALILVALTLLSACAATPETPDSGRKLTGIHGTVHNSTGEAISGATIYVYRNSRSGLRGPADFAATSDSEGRYLLDLAPGRYHLVARLRSSGSDSGPPRPGDAWALPSVNPVTLHDKQLKRLDFTLQQVQTRPIIASTLTDAPFTIHGQAVTRDGQALKSTIVLAYRQADLHHRPDYASSPASEDGHFTLYLPDTGPWCLVVRQFTRGQLRSGELHTLLGREDGTCRLRATPHLDLGQVVLTPYTAP